MGVPMRELEEVRLSVDQVEAIRLADWEGMYHEAAARRMGISRQTFGRIVVEARRRVAEALLFSKALVIEGGQVILVEEKAMHTRIATPTRGGQIDAHFGHCEYFSVFEIADNKIVAEKRVDSPDGCGCKTDIASVLAKDGVSLMLAGNMGEGAVRVLNANGIQVIRGASGKAVDVVSSYLDGKLKDSGVGCTAHDC